MSNSEGSWAAGGEPSMGGRGTGTDAVRLMLARRFLTPDHLTGGRIGWNIVNRVSGQRRKGHWAAATAGVRHPL